MTIIPLIHDYTTMSKAASAQLQRELGVENLFQAWMHREVPQRGVLSDGSEYQFHGIGVCIERTDGLDVDFDFGPGGRADGFDTWRLWLFATQFPTKYPNFQRQDQVEKALNTLIAAGIVKRCRAEGDPLLYLRSEIIN